MRLTKRLAVSAAAVLAGASALPGQLPENMTEANVMAAVDQHDIGTVEEFVAALPKLHKRHFMTLHQSESPAKALVDETHPRVVSWGADARFILAWITDASSEQVEFIRAAEDRWVAGLIDFSDSEPVLRHPAVCGDCHGALDRPIWGPKEFHGTASSTEGFNIAEGETLLREERLRTHVLTTTDPRLAPLERSGYSQPVRRAIEIKLEQLIDGRRIDNAASQAANWDFSALLSLRHGEILFRRARSRADYDGHALAVLTNDGPRTGDDEPWAGLFQEQDRVLDTLSGSGASVMGSSGGSSTHGGFYSGFGAGVWDVMTFLALYDAYERFPSVAALYRRTSNSGMFDSRRLNPEDRDIIEHRLLFPSGEATAEEELVAGYREFFELSGQAYLDQAAKREADGEPGAVGGRIRYNSEFMRLHRGKFASLVGQAIQTPPPAPPPPGPAPQPPAPPPPGPAPQPPAPPPPGPAPQPPAPPPPGPAPQPPAPPPPLGPPPPAPAPPPPGPDPGPPVAGFSQSADCVEGLCRARTGEPVSFADESTGRVRFRKWDFGDGAESRRPAPRHVWRAPGFHDVRLEVGDGEMTSSLKRTFLIEAAEPAGTCEADEMTRCLGDSRYAVRVRWRGSGETGGDGVVIRAGTNTSGLFRFFDDGNWEMLVKVLDGCASNGHAWVFLASSTDLGFEVEVTDTATGVVRSYGNEPGVAAPAITDTEAFACRAP